MPRQHGFRASFRALWTGKAVEPPATQVAEGVDAMRAAAARLSAVATSVTKRAELTTGQLIDQATDEAAAFDA